MAKPAWLRSLTVKLGVMLFTVVTGAVGVVYLAVLPQLESRLADAKLRGVESALPTVAAALGGADRFAYQDLVEFLAASQGARVVVLERLSDRSLVVVADSSGPRSSDLEGDRVALRAAASGERTSGFAERGDHPFAEAAVTARSGVVVLLSASLRDVAANVSLVRRSLLVAGVIALLASGLAGSLGAWRFIRRIRRLERAAERLAAGDFESPVVDRGHDEVAELARAFDAMRLRLSRLDRARRAFIANASHELRTPLFSLGGFLELLVDEELDEATRRDFLLEMRAQVERLRRLATDLLDLSQLDTGQLPVERTEVDLTECARTAVEEFGPVAEAEGRPLRLDVPEPILALADEQRVLQIARILVENALRHTPRGTAIQVRAAPGARGPELSVRDEGPGIPPDERERVFERFYRADGGAASGSGLGLAIARELADAMGGAVHLVSDAGATTFRLALPPVPQPALSRENAALAAPRA